MKVERTEDEIILRLSANIDIDDLSEFIDYLKFREITAGSKASRSDADKFLKEVKKGRWKRTKKKLDL